MAAIRIAQVVGLTSAGLLAGSNALYTYCVIPTLLSSPASEEHLISQWRHMFVIGFYATGPQCGTNLLLFSFLAYTARTVPRVRNLYVVAALIIPSILPYTWTIQRALNGALCKRAEKLIGPGSGTVAETLGKGERRTMELEGRKSTVELVGMWGRYNGLRVIIGTVGSLVAGWACLEHAAALGRPIYITVVSQT